MRIEKIPRITTKFCDIPIGTICYDKEVVSDNVYMKVSDEDGTNVCMLCLSDGRTIEVDANRDFVIAEPNFIYKSINAPSSQLPRAIFFGEIYTSSGTVILYKNIFYIISDLLVAYSLASGIYTPINSRELVINADNLIHFEIKNKI